MKRLLPPLLAIFVLCCMGCGHMPRKSTLIKIGKNCTEAGVGVGSASLVHQAGHFGPAWTRGYKMRFSWSDEYIPNEHIEGDWPDPWVAFGGLGLEMIVDELLNWLIKKEKRGIFFYFYTGTTTFNQLNYCRRGIMGEGDLSERKFGKNHEIAGLLSGAHGFLNLYRLSKDPKVRKKATEVKEKTKKWWERVKVRLIGDFKYQYGVQVMLELP